MGVRAAEFAEVVLAPQGPAVESRPLEGGVQPSTLQSQPALDVVEGETRSFQVGSPHLDPYELRSRGVEDARELGGAVEQTLCLELPVEPAHVHLSGSLQTEAGGCHAAPSSELEARAVDPEAA